MYTDHSRLKRAVIGTVRCTMTSIPTPTPDIDIDGTHYLQGDAHHRMVKHKRDRISDSSVHVLMLNLKKIVPGHQLVDTPWKLRTEAARENGTLDANEIALENVITISVDGLQEVATVTETEKGTVRQGTTAGVGVEVHGEIDHPTMEVHLAER